MSSVERLRECVNQRLTAADEEIFRVFKQTIVGYEEEIDRQRGLLDIIWKPEVKLHRIELPQQHVCKEEKVLADQQLCNQERNSSLDQEEPEPPQIKEEEEELCITQEEEQLVLKQETDTFMWTPTYEESDHSEDQTLYFNPDKTQSTAEKESVVNTADDDVYCNIHSDNKSFKCDTCGKTFKYKSTFSTHVMIHTDEKPFLCKTCGRRFNRMSHLKRHLLVHTGEKPFLCKTCGQTFSRMSHLTRHMLIHTGERPFLCKTCGLRFSRTSDLKRHMLIHTGVKPFLCKSCGRRFSRISHLKTHMFVHTGESEKLQHPAKYVEEDSLG